ncbi:MAG: DUF1015 domain-containing protein [Actinobacteria bacterium]|nr:DUF1015 domain-containing protein [Actinomycetota bacterium]
MSQVSPFTGLLFDQARVGSPALVTTPPYDTITAGEQRRYVASSPHNMVRVVLGEDRPGDDERSNKYTRAASEFWSWRDDGALVPTPVPSYYPYEMRFAFRGENRRLRGLVCEVELEPWGGSIVPHERTMAAPVEDRLLLMRTVRANLSAVYAVFFGPSRPFAGFLNEATKEPPRFEMTDEAGVGHSMWVVDGREDVGAWLAGERLLIADGHHRYTMALRYRDEMRERHGPGPWDRVMMLVVDASTEDPPVLPIHRVLTSGPATRGGERVLSLEEVLAEVSDDDLVYGLATRGHAGEVVHWVARLDGEPPTVCALHHQVLDAMDGYDALRFTPDAAEAEEAVRSGDAAVAFFLPATTAERIRSVIDRGERLPQKSTFFWPKPRTGMVMRPLDQT